MERRSYSDIIEEDVYASRGMARFFYENIMLIERLMEPTDILTNEGLDILQKEYNFYAYLYEHYGVQPEGRLLVLEVPEIFMLHVTPYPRPLRPHVSLVIFEYLLEGDERKEWVIKNLGRMLKFKNDFPPRIIRVIVDAIREEVPEFVFENDDLI